MTFAVADYPRM